MKKKIQEKVSNSNNLIYIASPSTQGWIPVYPHDGYRWIHMTDPDGSMLWI